MAAADDRHLMGEETLVTHESDSAVDQSGTVKMIAMLDEPTMMEMRCLLDGLVTEVWLGNEMWLVDDTAWWWRVGDHG